MPEVLSCGGAKSPSFRLHLLLRGQAKPQQPEKEVRFLLLKKSARTLRRNLRQYGIARKVILSNKGRNCGPISGKHFEVYDTATTSLLGTWDQNIRFDLGPYSQLWLFLPGERAKLLAQLAEHFGAAAAEKVTPASASAGASRGNGKWPL